MKYKSNKSYVHAGEIVAARDLRFQVKKKGQMNFSIQAMRAIRSTRHVLPLQSGQIARDIRTSIRRDLAAYMAATESVNGCRGRSGLIEGRGGMLACRGNCIGGIKNGQLRGNPVLQSPHQGKPPKKRQRRTPGCEEPFCILTPGKFTIEKES